MARTRLTLARTSAYTPKPDAASITPYRKWNSLEAYQMMAKPRAATLIATPWKMPLTSRSRNTLLELGDGPVGVLPVEVRELDDAVVVEAHRTQHTLVVLDPQQVPAELGRIVAAD